MKILKHTKTYENCPKGCRGKLSYLHDYKEHKTCSCGTKWNRLTNNLVVNNYSIEKCKNADGNNIPNIFLQWSAKHLFSNEVFFSNKKKECISWAEKQTYENVK